VSEATGAAAERAPFAIVDGGNAQGGLEGHYGDVRRIAALPSHRGRRRVVSRDGRHRPARAQRLLRVCAGQRRADVDRKARTIPSYAEPFERDERLALAAAGGEVIAAHAPRLLSRFTLAGVEASVESAAIGSRVTSLLAQPGSRTAKLA
jgi:hypothetical protein